ncbi:PP2C family serine/threonine-protein phosphatase [Variovorax sp. Sphag1AA]|uniref:PP2C family protein-serine/threonine phosphatase n=1 Tax=Variovorax sp. Sphag1AA TaxID=2587027 RepID=UPI001613D331|nr:protein phosphatase 2C domain-containing protein [Variovorax sp. Sphag1AA]MBB3180784.1 serine/threonine protein phosphatase PrpC [Variovorax sp. Sphag1AA]
MDVEIVFVSKQGGRSYNEDVFGQWSNDRFVACLVADGAGGHGGGDVAADIARTSVLEAVAAAPGLNPGRLRHLLEQANRDVVARQAEGGRLADMRSTVVVALLDLEVGEVAWVHAGDSRAYLFRDGEQVARTTDHSLVQQLVNGGMIDEERARLHPQRNLLLSALGAPDGDVEIDVSRPMPVRVGDVVLLCSDGVWEVLGDQRLGEILRASLDPHQLIARIDTEISLRAAPGYDNYTAVVMWLHSDEETTQPLPLGP